MSPRWCARTGSGSLPGAVNELTRGRREVKEMTGNYWVPLLLIDDGEAIQGSEKIIAWAQAHPATRHAGR